MKPSSQKYYHYAEECRRRASQVTNAEARASWHQVAESWLLIADYEDRWGVAEPAGVAGRSAPSDCDSTAGR